ncbi:30S ribosomal protein S1 [Candidatus Roizmanbacteria bacterium]|nr:30S ribosomal protein S1 [Candidatus Roizmanbacteria bacterium]
MTMADLMKRAQPAVVAPKKGDILTGIITKLTSSEVIVDINAKTEAVVLEKDKSILRKILSSYKVGDKVQVQVLNPESDFGYPVVSMRRSIDNIVWDKLTSLQKSQEPLEIVLDQSTKGGFLVSSPDGISGFLPNSHTSSLENPQGLIGKKIKVVVLELNRNLHKIIFSQKQVMGDIDFQKLIENLKIGQKIDAIVSNVAPFGVFLSIPISDGKQVEGFIHISETSWENVPSISEVFKIGDKVTGVILGFDKESRRVNLSIKRLKADPLEKKLDEFTVDKKLMGRVSKIMSTGVLMDLGEGISGFIKKDKIPPSVSYKEEQEVQVLVSGIDKRRHRVELVPVLKEKPIGYR